MWGSLHTCRRSTLLAVSLLHLASGKVREIYEIDEHHLLFVATDRVSAYDVIMTQTIPDKGRVLTQLSSYFFDLIDAPNHMISSDVGELDIEAEPGWLHGRSMVVRRAEMLPMECVVRGYLYGSAWREYSSGGGPTTEHLPSGLEMGARLDEPIFTPASKAESGHDENLTEAQARALVGDALYQQLAEVSIAIYQTAADHVRDRGLLIADTKFEFGHVDGTLTLCDEAFTPDSSRYWPANEYRPGTIMPSFDKQYLRDWLDSTGWDHTPPPPDLPDVVVTSTRDRYLEAFQKITGESLENER